nr:trihelix transcription factor GT-2-like [Ipomoea batatas]
MDTKYQENGPKGPLWEEVAMEMQKLGHRWNAKRCKLVLAQLDLKQNQSLTLPVVMSSDHVSRFLALPCPYQPPWAEKIVVEVQKPPPPKPLRGPEAVPFY